MPGRKIRDEREARECLEAAARSGLDRAEWARRNGLDARSLNAWRLNVERRDREPAGALRVVELVPTSSRSAAAPLRVRCGPFVVEVGDDFDDELLARLLGVVASC